MEQMHSQINTFAPTGKRTYSVDEMNDLCKTNCFKVVRVGSAIRISKTSFDSWLESIEPIGG